MIAYNNENDIWPHIQCHYIFSYGILMSDFSSFSFIAPILRNIKAHGFSSPTAIQEKAIPMILSGRDVLASAQTGTGKTAAFVLPIIQQLTLFPTKKGHPRAIIISPTRELATQIGEQLSIFSQSLSLTHTVIFGGVSREEQIERLKSPFDIIIATPGRLLDLLSHKVVSCSQVQFFVLDETDQMLDKGFLPDITRLFSALPSKRQNLLFSATISKDVMKLASQFLHKPVRLDIMTQTDETTNISQQVFYVNRLNKHLLLQQLLRSPSCTKSIVFVRTKNSAQRLTSLLQKEGFGVDSLHGDKAQSARFESLSAFADGRINILIATDVASRGIDIGAISHVFNFDVPEDATAYVHRIGRTGRAGSLGNAVTICSQEETIHLDSIEKLLQKDIQDEVEHKWHCSQAFRAQIILRTERLQQTKKQAERPKKNTRSPKRFRR